MYILYSYITLHKNITCTLNVYFTDECGPCETPLPKKYYIVRGDIIFKQ